MKRLTALAMAFLTLIMIFPVTIFAADDPKDSTSEKFNGVTITFSVGDSTLTVNGEKMTVQTPYIVAGTTLVPLRVITEAFGAEVNWEQTTKTITIIYKEVVIKLTIGDKNVFVNGEKSELIAAPELTNSTTMVPLRFITESFGADVSYDEKTKGITVKKEIIESNSIKDYALIMKRSTKEKLGDSYFGWSINRPIEMQLKSRSFSGNKNTLEVADEGRIVVNVNEKSDKDTIDGFNAILEKLGSTCTVINKESGKTAAGVEYAKIQLKSSVDYSEVIYYIGENNIFSVMVFTTIEDGIKGFNHACDIADSFQLTFDKKATEDLSDVNKETNLHLFNSKDMALQVEVPGFLRDGSNPDASNKFLFVSTKNSRAFPDMIHIAVYSSTKDSNYASWAQSDLDSNKRTTNKDYFTYSDLDNLVVDGKTALYYVNKTSYKSFNFTEKDIFIDAGNYFYNITITLHDNDTSDKLMQGIVNSIKIGEINAEEIGKMIRTKDADEKYKEYKEPSHNLKLSVPTSWDNDISSDSMYFDNNSTYLSVSSTDIASAMSVVSFKEWCERVMYTPMQQRSDFKILDSALVANKSVGDGAYEFAARVTVNDLEYDKIVKFLLVKKGNVAYMLQFSVPEIYWGIDSQETYKKIISSINFDS